MPPLINYILEAAAITYFLIIIVEVIQHRALKRFFIELGLLFLMCVLLFITTGFPQPSQLVPFGGMSPILSVTIMFVCVVLGMVANFFFYQKGVFSWRSFLKPIVVSPIVLLPLIGSVQGQTEIEDIQMISLAILGFQNGFFWKFVFEQARQQVSSQ